MGLSGYLQGAAEPVQWQVDKRSTDWFSAICSMQLLPVPTAAVKINLGEAQHAVTRCVSSSKTFPMLGLVASPTTR
jgi:hypothetical protein